MGFFFLEYLVSIFTFQYYANEEISPEIFTEAVFFKLGARNVYHKRTRMIPAMLLPWQNSWLQSLSVKNQISLFGSFKSGTKGLARNKQYDRCQVIGLQTSFLFCLIGMIFKCHWERFRKVCIVNRSDDALFWPPSCFRTR